MISAISNLLDRANVLQQDRPLVCRVLARAIFGISSYHKDRAKLKFNNSQDPELVKESEAKIWEFARSMSWDRRVATSYWRALGCLLSTKDSSRACTEHQINQADLWFLFDSLDESDVNEFVTLDRDWRVPAISDSTINEILKLCKQHINSCVYRLRFIWQNDPAKPKEDWDSYFVSEAIHTIFKYEDRHSLVHLVNTVKTALENKQGIMAQRFSSEKQGNLIRNDTLEKGANKTAKSLKGIDTNLKQEMDTVNHRTFTNRRATLMIEGPDGESENPELASRSTRTEPSIDTKLFIARVDRAYKHLARYLRLIVLDEADDEFFAWVEDENLDIDSELDFKRHAALFCNVGRQDFLHLKSMVEQDYPISQFLIKRAAKHKEEDRRKALVKAKFHAQFNHTKNVTKRNLEHIKRTGARV